MDVQKIKKDFPFLQRKINGKSIVYLDSAAMSQVPQVVIDTVSKVYANGRTNVDRGIYTISEEVTNQFEMTRRKTAKFINAKEASEIVFTQNTTNAINYIAYGLGQTLRKGDTILISEMEHHSNILPWQRIAREKGARLLFVRINNDGVLTNEVVDEENKLVFKHFKDIPRLKIVSIAHASNVLGTINPIEKLIKDLRLMIEDVRIVVDAAQSAPHMSIDVQKMDCDLLAFSGYKLLGPTGVGVLYGKRELLEEMEPLLIGSHMISEVTKKGATWADISHKFEPGTAAVEAVIGLGAAIDYLQKIGMNEIRNHELRIMNYALEKVVKLDGVTVYGPKDTKIRGGVLTFNVDGVHPHDVAQCLNDDNICVRSGHHCAMPLHQKFGLDSSTRASLYIYNDESDVDKLVEGIGKVKKLFKIPRLSNYG